MGLKEKIQQDFIVAMKCKNEVGKSTLSSLKAKITEGEKSNSNKPLSDEEILKVIITAVKQRKQSIEEFKNGGRLDLVEKEEGELSILLEYMPVQMSEDEIKLELTNIIDSISTGIKNRQAIVGKTIGEFNKRFSGKADIKFVKEIVESLV